MPLYQGTGQASAVYVGGTPAKAVYLGATQVWSSFTPGVTAYTTPGTYTYTIPTGCTKFRVIQIGGGAGGTNGGVIGNGQGGKAAASWFDYTWTRGGEVPLSTTQLTVVVGAGGPNGASPASNGVASSINGTGLVWTFEYPAGTFHPNNPGPIQSAAGAGGMGVVNVVGGAAPNSPALNGVTYPGGKGGQTLGAVGSSPGGGGAGGGANANGGKGGGGAVYIYAF
jgi:hypothetical protein